jgi:imidazolonepropionase-like amidohydrolase
MEAVKANLLYDGTGNKPRKNCWILFDREVKGITDTKPDAEIIGEGVVTPAFVDGHCHMGMVRSGEPEEEEESNEEMGTMTPLADALNSVYMDDSSFRDSVEWGVLYSHIMPGSGNILGGKTVFVRNYAADIEEALVKRIGMKSALGFNPRATTEWKGKRPTTRMGAVAMLREEFLKAQKEQKLVSTRKKRKEEVEPFTEEIIKILKRKLPLIAHVHRADDLIVLSNLVEEFGIKVIANHCGDVNSNELWAKLRKRNIPVIYGPIDAFPYKTELKHMNWRNLQGLMETGPKFGLMTDHPVTQQRTLPLQIRYPMRLGMSGAEAISLITKRNADILGVNEVGSLEKGKWASLIVWKGDPFSLGNYPKLVIGEGKVLHEEN